MKGALFALVVILLLVSCQEKTDNEEYCIKFHSPLSGIMSNTNKTKDIKGGGKCKLNIRTSEYFIEHIPGEKPRYQMAIKMDILSDKKIYYVSQLSNDARNWVAITAYGPLDTTYKRLFQLEESATSVLHTWPQPNDSSLERRAERCFANSVYKVFESKDIGTKGELEFKIYFKPKPDKSAPVDSIVSKVYYKFKL